MIDKINVVSLTSGMGISGTTREIIAIHKYLNKDFFNHFVISLGSKNDPNAHAIEPENIFFLSDPTEIAKTLKEKNIHVVYAHRHGRNEPAHDAIAKAMGSEVVLMEMNTFSAKDNGYFGQRCEKHVFVSSTNVVKYCVQNNIEFDFKKYKTINGLLDCEIWQNNPPSEPEIQRYKEKLGIAGHFVVGRIARPVMGKWDDEMLVMWSRLSKISPNIKLLVYGVPPERRKQMAEAGNKDNLIMFDSLGSDDELGLFYSAIDVLVHTSPIGECSCGTIAEAMLFKKPVVVRSTPFPRYTLGRTHTKDNGQVEQIRNGVNGYVVTNGVAMAYALEALRAAPDTMARMGQKNYEDVLAIHNAKVGIQTFEKMFIEGMLDRKNILSEQIVTYYNAHEFFPDESTIKNWFTGYYRQLKEIFGTEYHHSIAEKIFLLSLLIQRKIKTALRIIRG